MNAEVVVASVGIVRHGVLGRDLSTPKSID